MRAVIQHLPAGRYRLANAVARHASGRRFWSHYQVAGRKVRFLCNLGDSIAREVCFTGMYEPLETRCAHAFLKPGDTFVDVGANWGYFSLLAACLVGNSGRVIALEPEPTLHRQLTENIEENRFQHVRALRVAASDSRGKARFSGSSEHHGNSGLNRLLTETSAQPQHGITAPTDTLDALLETEHLGRIALLKMDIEGAEALAVPGLEQTLARRLIDRILLEIHPELVLGFGKTLRTICGQFLKHGYEAYVIPHGTAEARDHYYSSPTAPPPKLSTWDGKDQQGAWPHFLFTLPKGQLQ